MKGKRHATEQKIRILREADGGMSVAEVSKGIISPRSHSIVGNGNSDNSTSTRPNG